MAFLVSLIALTVELNRSNYNRKKSFICFIFDLNYNLSADDKVEYRQEFTDYDLETAVRIKTMIIINNDAFLHRKNFKS